MYISLAGTNNLLLAQQPPFCWFAMFAPAAVAPGSTPVQHDGTIHTYSTAIIPLPVVTVTYPFSCHILSYLLLEFAVDLAAYHRWQCVGVILFQNTVTQRRGNTAINALSKTARWRRCLQASRNTSHYIRSIHFWEHFHKPTRPSRLCLSGAEKQARNTFCIFLYLFCQTPSSLEISRDKPQPRPYRCKTHTCVVQQGLADWHRIAHANLGLRIRCFGGFARMAKIKFLRTCATMPCNFMRAMFLQQSLVILVES